MSDSMQAVLKRCVLDEEFLELVERDPERALSQYELSRSERETLLSSEMRLTEVANTPSTTTTTTVITTTTTTTTTTSATAPPQMVVSASRETLERLVDRVENSPVSDRYSQILELVKAI